MHKNFYTKRTVDTPSTDTINEIYNCLDNIKNGNPNDAIGATLRLKEISAELHSFAKVKEADYIEKISKGLVARRYKPVITRKGNRSWVDDNLAAAALEKIGVLDVWSVRTPYQIERKLEKESRHRIMSQMKEHIQHNHPILGLVPADDWHRRVSGAKLVTFLDNKKVRSEDLEEYADTSDYAGFLDN